jgi:hypothetical protein
MWQTVDVVEVMGAAVVVVAAVGALEDAKEAEEVVTTVIAPPVNCAGRKAIQSSAATRGSMPLSPVLLTPSLPPLRRQTTAPTAIGTWTPVPLITSLENSTS